MINVENNDITFKQWVRTDRSCLITQNQNVQEFISTLNEKLNAITTNSYIAGNFITINSYIVITIITAYS